jgi:hypothetical protein
MLRRFSSFGTGCLLLGRFRISIYEVSNVKETYTSGKKIPGGGLFRNPF